MSITSFLSFLKALAHSVVIRSNTVFSSPPHPHTTHPPTNTPKHTQNIGLAISDLFFS